MRRLELTGMRFTRLTVISFIGSVNGSTEWECKCDCGNIIISQGKMLTSSNTKSCGCLLSDRNKDRAIHNSCHTEEYAAWNQMLQRCGNKNNPGYKHYGARGITVCEKWHNFTHFYKDMGIKPGSNYSLDRIDNNGNYEPSNCRWAVQLTQCNNRRSNKLIEFNNSKRTLAEWSREVNINASTISRRLKYNWSVHDALTIGVK